MRTIHTSIQPSSPLYPTHHSQTFMSSHRCHNIFKSAIMVAFRRSKNLTNLLVRVNPCKSCYPSQNNIPHPSRGVCIAAVILFNVPRNRRVKDPLAKRAIKNDLVPSCHEWGEFGKSQKLESQDPPKNYGEIRVIASKKKSTTLFIFYRLNQIITYRNKCVYPIIKFIINGCTYMRVCHYIFLKVAPYRFNCRRSPHDTYRFYSV